MEKANLAGSGADSWFGKQPLRSAITTGTRVVHIMCSKFCFLANNLSIACDYQKTLIKGSQEHPRHEMIEIE